MAGWRTTIGRRQTQGVGDLLALLVHPLAGADDLNTAIWAYKAQAGFGLEIGVFLRLSAIGRLDDDIGLGKAGVDVALFEGVAVQYIGVEVAFAIGKAEGVGVEDGGIRLHGGDGVSDKRQWLIAHLDQLGGGLRLRFGLRDHDGDMIRLPTHDFRLRVCYRHHRAQAGRA